MWAVNVVVGVGKFQIAATLNARWMEFASSALFWYLSLNVCLCFFVFVSVKLGKDVDNVGVGKFLRRLHCGQVDVGGGRAERKVASWVSAPPVRAVVLPCSA